MNKKCKFIAHIGENGFIKCDCQTTKEDEGSP